MNHVLDILLLVIVVLLIAKITNWFINSKSKKISSLFQTFFVWFSHYDLNNAPSRKQYIYRKTSNFINIGLIVLVIATTIFWMLEAPSVENIKPKK
jgi:ABC-type phosphate/phosphonate transport system permease subunit